MRMRFGRVGRVGKVRAILFAASALVLSCGAAVAGSGMAVAGVAPNGITLPSVGNQSSVAYTAVTPLAITATATDGLPLNWTAAGLPPGLGIAPSGSDADTGVITGTDSAPPGTYTVTVTATDASPATATTAAFTWTITKSTITVTTPANQKSGEDAAVTPLAITATDSGGLPLTWNATGLPTGLTITASTSKTDTEVISGTAPGAPGVYDVTVTAYDATGALTSASFTWTFVLDTITVTMPRTEQSDVGVAIAPVQIKAHDPVAGQRLTYNAAPLPSGLTINRVTGVITGKPRALTSVVTEVTVTDLIGSTGGVLIRWQVGARISIVNPGGRVLILGEPVDLTLAARASLPRYPLTLQVSGLPLGMSFKHRPALSGWPLRAGVYHVVITATGKDGGIARLGFAITVRAAPNSGPTGVIDLGTVGMCLDDPGGKSAVGTPVDIRVCNGSAAQLWTMATDGTIRIRGRCATIVSGLLRLAVCTASATQTWVVGTDAELVNPATGRCIADPGSSTRNGIRPTLATCAAAQDEQWSAPGSPIFAGLPGRCVADRGNSGASGTVIDAFSCNRSVAQSWQLLSDGTIRIFGNECLTVAGAAGRVGAKIELLTCAIGDAGQSWRIVTHGTFVAEIENRGACLAVPSNTAPNGTQLRLAACSATAPTDLWHD